MSWVTKHKLVFSFICQEENKSNFSRHQKGVGVKSQHLVDSKDLDGFLFPDPKTFPFFSTLGILSLHHSIIWNSIFLVKWCFLMKYLLTGGFSTESKCSCMSF